MSASQYQITLTNKKLLSTHCNTVYNCFISPCVILVQHHQPPKSRMANGGMEGGFVDELVECRSNGVHDWDNLMEKWSRARRDLFCGVEENLE